MSSVEWVFFITFILILSSGVSVVTFFVKRLYDIKKADEQKPKEKRKGLPEGKFKNDGTFTDIHGNEYEIIEDEYSGSIMPVRRFNYKDSMDNDDTRNQWRNADDDSIQSTVMKIWDEHVNRRLSDMEWKARFPVDITEADMDKPYLDELAPVYNFATKQFDHHPKKDSPFDYEVSEELGNNAVVVDIPVTIQDWSGFPRGAYINNTKRVGDVVKLLDGRWVQVVEVLENGRYRMRVLDWYESYLNSLREHNQRTSNLVETVQDDSEKMKKALRDMRSEISRRKGD